MTEQSTQRPAVLRTAIILAVIVQIGATFLPSLGLGEPIGERSDSVRTLITPAGYAFAIWGPLFFGSAVFALWQALPAQKDNSLLQRLGWWPVPALASQGVWALYTQFANLTAFSAIIILTSLISLLVILRKLVSHGAEFSTGERWIVALTFSALAAWLTAASIVNITASLVYHGVGSESGYPGLTAALVGVGGLVAALATVRSKGNPWYAAVFFWALVAIYNRGGQQHSLIAVSAVASAVLMLAAVIVGLRVAENRKRWLG